jgi:hypothetical protein
MSEFIVMLIAGELIIYITTMALVSVRAADFLGKCFLGSFGIWGVIGVFMLAM